MVCDPVKVDRKGAAALSPVACPCSVLHHIGRFCARKLAGTRRQNEGAPRRYFAVYLVNRETGMTSCSQTEGAICNSLFGVGPLCPQDSK